MVAVLVQRAYRAQGKWNLRLISWLKEEWEKEGVAEEKRAAEEEAARLKQIEADEKLARSEEERFTKITEEEERERLRQEVEDEMITKEIELVERDIDEVADELEGEEEDDEEGSEEEVSDDEGVDENEMAEDREIKVAMERSIEAGAPSAKISALVRGPTNLRKFGHVDEWIAYLAMNKKPVHSERSFHPEALANKEFKARCKVMGIEKLVGLQENRSWELCRKIYANIVRRVAT